ncbi:MAG: histidinol-phosphatase HisJ family protein [Verrucomicrobiota bacterium]
MLFDYHVHTPLCLHAVGEPREYVQAAIARGLSEIGFADHNPMPIQMDDWRMSMDDFPKYLQMIAEVRGEFPNFPIRLGMECDFIPGYENHIRSLAAQADFDYLIGSVHYILPGWDVDNPKKIELWKTHPHEEVWELYFKALTQAACSGIFDFLGHPDLVKKFGFLPKGDLSPYYQEALDAIADHKLAIELNTAGLRKDANEIYPSRAFLEGAFKRDIPILINSDAHDPSEVGQDFDAAFNLARSVGYSSLLRFEKRRPIFVGFSY